MEDLIEIGVDVIQQDQQMNMGLDKLSKYKGRICFFNPADIQFTSNNNNTCSIEKYCKEMVDKLADNKGGFMYKMYSQPSSIEIPFKSLEIEINTFYTYNPYKGS